MADSDLVRRLLALNSMLSTTYWPCWLHAPELPSLWPLAGAVIHLEA